MFKKLLVLAFSVGFLSSSNAEETPPKWSVANELLHYQSISNAPGCETGMILAPLTYLARSTNSQTALEMIGRLTGGASRFMLLQRVNIENGIYQVTLAVQPARTNQWELYKFNRSARGTPFVIRHGKRADELFDSSLSSNGGMDCSRNYIFDGTAAYVTVGNAAKMVHFAVYEPATIGGKSIAAVNFESLSSLVTSLSELD
jgi:hypothetical protein